RRPQGDAARGSVDDGSMACRIRATWAARAAQGVARSRCPPADSGRGRGRRARAVRAAGAVGRRARRGAALLSVAVRAAVGAVEPRALEDHTDGTEDLTQLSLAAGALAKRLVGELLDDF